MNISKYFQLIGLILTVGLTVSVRADSRAVLKVPFD